MHGKEVAMSPISRRTFLTTAATAAGSVALGCGDHPMIAPTRAQLIGGLLPDPASCGIEHVVVFMMENRSFDRSEEHTSELQSQSNLVCRLLLEKKNRSPTPHPRRRDLRSRPTRSVRPLGLS